MKYLLPSAVFMLMVSIGISLNLRRFAANWRRLNRWTWLRLILATFILPPIIALCLVRIFNLNPSDTAGLFLISVAPGAPLMSRAIANKGFDSQLAASYQVWGALLIPVMIPVIVAASAKLYGLDVWIRPTALIIQIVQQQFVPLLVGIALMYFLPEFSEKAQRALNVVGNSLLIVALVLMLAATGPKIIRNIDWMLPVAAVLLAVGCILSVRWILRADAYSAETLAMSNANRHVGLALLLAGQNFGTKDALTAAVCYALVAPLVMTTYARLFSVKAERVSGTSEAS